MPRTESIAKARQKLSREPPMSAILVILAFVVVIGALNLYEFGRID
ncbi:hypothetical protein [Phenylobacterium sp.]